MERDFKRTLGMNEFQERIEAWLSRALPERAVTQCFDLPAVLATDVGLERSENQDRVAALRISTNNKDSRSLVAIAVADGMGGMRDGAKCATLTLSSFFYALTRYRSYGIEKRATAAIADANDTVFKFAEGKGGATLSAILLDNELRPLLVHLGDSRIYSFGSGEKVQRLTTDDSLAEAVGGHGRDLLQFVGMGEGMQPHIKLAPSGVRHVALTTDGIHYIEFATLESILLHATGLKSASERLAAIARWCGGADNASLALVDLESLAKDMQNGAEQGIQLWDPFGSLTAMWIKTNAPFQGNRLADAETLRDSKVLSSSDPAQKHSKRKSTPKKSKKNKRDNPQKEDVQLEIQIERSLDPEDSNEDSR